MGEVIAAVIRRLMRETNFPTSTALAAREDRSTPFTTTLRIEVS